MVEMLQNGMQPTTFYKVRRHANIDRREQADRLAKVGCRREYKFAAISYEFAHSILYYSRKDL